MNTGIFLMGFIVIWLAAIVGAVTTFYLTIHEHYWWASLVVALYGLFTFSVI